MLGFAFHHTLGPLSNSMDRSTQPTGWLADSHRGCSYRSDLGGMEQSLLPPLGVGFTFRQPLLNFVTAFFVAAFGFES